MEESTRSEVDPVGGPRGRRTIRQMVVFGVIATAVGITLGLVIDWFPAQGSTQAEKIDTFWDVLIICSVPFFVLVLTVVLFAVRDFRQRPGQEGMDGAPIHGNTKLEVVWTAVPAIVLVALCTYAFIVLDDIEKAPAAGTERVVAVRGEQFTWTFTYNEGGKKFSSPQLYVPIGESVKFDIRSEDVLHSFWVPAWRIKIDSVPGITTHYRITPTRLGAYPVVCAELCGLGHAFMRQTAHVLSREDFVAWVDKQVTAREAPAAGGGAGGGDTAAAGKETFTTTGCGACHKLADAGTNGGVGPDLDTVLKGKDAAFIEQSIVDPDAEIADGFQSGIMPKSYRDTLAPAALKGLVTYLEEVAAK